jgi:hypothetical protein
LREAHELIESMRNQQQHAAQAGSTPPPAPLLGSFTLQDVARAASAGADPSLRWRAEEWHPKKDTIVALAFRPVEFGARPEALDPRLVVLQNRGGKLSLIAEKKFDLSHADCPNESGEPAGGDDRAPDLALDLGAYAIAPAQMAIGVRFMCAKTFPATEGVETRLSLFALQDGTLRQVFDEKIASTNYYRPAGNTITTSGAVSVQREQHAGHFDLELRLKTKTQGSDPNAFPNTTRQPIESIETRRFVWNGRRYEAVKGR